MTLRLLLALLGSVFWLASRSRDSFRRQLSRDLVVEIFSAEGVARHFTFEDRRATSRSGRAAAADLSIRFPSARVGARALVASDGPDLLYEGLLDGSIEIKGDRRLLLWLLGLVPAAVPGLPVFRLRKTPPSPYVRPAPGTDPGQRIVREPATETLDASQTAAWAVREKLHMMRIAAGARPKPF